MIYSDRQYGISSGELNKLKAALAATMDEYREDAWLQDIEIEGLKSQIVKVEAELSHYDLLKAGEITFTKSHSLYALPNILVQARIASGMSQSDLARKLGLKPQQVQRYEATGYMGASLARLIEVSKILNVHTASGFKKDEAQRGAIFSWYELDDIVWQEFPVREMVNRRWFNLPHGANQVECLKSYFINAAGPEFATALHRKKMRSATIPNEYALLAWQARVLERARNRIAHEQIPAFRWDDQWLPELVALTKLDDGPKRTRALLASKGIILVTEKHLSGIHMDGAAMLSATDHPVIGLTLRHDRLDNFWFVLLHELGHIFRHLKNGLRYDFFDDDSSETADQVEFEADQYALNGLIPDKQWDQCRSRIALSEEAVRMDADTLNIDVSIIAGRIRRERGDYTILADLVGYRKVRAQMTEATDDLE